MNKHHHLVKRFCKLRRLFIQCIFVVSLGFISHFAHAQTNQDPTFVGLDTAPRTFTGFSSVIFGIDAGTFNDVDSGSNDVSLFMVASAGTFGFANPALDGIDIFGNGSGNVEFRGPVSNIEAYLNIPSNIRYFPEDDVLGFSVATVTLSANDNGNSGTGGGSDVMFGVININVLPGSADQKLVTNTNDSGAGSLREVISTADAGDTILFATSLAGQTITLTSGQISLTQDLTIDGSALSALPNGQVIISGNDSSRIFEISNGANVNMVALTLTDGSGGNGGIMQVTQTGSTLNLSDSTLRDSSAEFEGGALRLNGNVSATVERCLFTGNVAGSFGSAISNNGGDLTLLNSTLINGQSATGSAAVDLAGGTFNALNNTMVIIKKH